MLRKFQYKSIHPLNTYFFVFSHTHTHAHTHTHTHIHTYIYMCVYIHMYVYIIGALIFGQFHIFGHSVSTLKGLYWIIAALIV